MAKNKQQNRNRVAATADTEFATEVAAQGKNKAKAGQSQKANQ
ncbi:hypothetical protein NV379_19485 [Paenibacillus sp. N1-5-1-14]|nr:hypothetical protein [Paenibacillus radicibacter]MCR8644839.1 hypothetical protein [Paenibacillus radicibacter]